MEQADIYQLKREILGELESLSEDRKIDLYYADEASVSLTPCVPYAWQFKDEEVSMPSEQGKGVNCFALLSRDNRAVIETTTEMMTSQFLFEQIERFSVGLQKLSVIVLDNAAVHRARIIKERLAVWQQRGLFLFYLPRYSPHLNIVETLWRKLKYEWLTAKDYQTRDTLCYAVRLALRAVGESLRINFSSFNLSLL
ncbi:MAG: IS630 family transposase [Acidobacteria bacterium]|nr:IS630 family transposase [Acidobacteriota bacterium]